MNEFIRPEGKWWLVITEKRGYEDVDDYDAMYRIAAEQDVPEIVAEEMMMEIMLENKHETKQIGTVRWVPKKTMRTRNKIMEYEFKRIPDNCSWVEYWVIRDTMENLERILGQGPEDPIV